MPSFVIYDPTSGAVSGLYTVSHAANLDSVMTANTPRGACSLVVDSGHPVVSNQSGWQVQDGAVVAVVATAVQLLAAAQATQLAILTASYNAAKTANVAYMSTSFMADAESQDIFAHAMTAYTAIGATPSDFYAVDASYNKVPMTLDQLKGLIEAISTQVWAAFQRWITVRQALAAATTVDEVQAVVWS